MLTLLPHEEDEAKVRCDDEAGKARDQESDVWEPERLGIEAEHGQDGRGGDFDVDAICKGKSACAQQNKGRVKRTPTEAYIGDL